MRRTATTILASALLGTVLLQPVSASGTGETCQGQPATVVGRPGGAVEGTDGADVIVTNGAIRVGAGAGDDLICVTGDASSTREPSRDVVLDAGDGNDSVEATAPGWSTLTTLGNGADSYVGSSGGDQQIWTGDVLGSPDVDVDVVRVTVGIATVYSGSDSRPNADVVDIRSGVVQWTGDMSAGGQLTGHSVSTLRTVARSGDATIDARRGTAVTETSSATFSGFTDHEFMTFATQGTLTYRGTDGSDRLSVEARDTYDRVVDLGGGRDFYASDGFGGRRSTYDGGAGRDQLLLATPDQRVHLDLDDGRATARHRTRTVRRTFAGFEDLAVAARKAKVRGTASGEEITVIACRAAVSAGGGADRVHFNAYFTDGWEMPTCGSRRGSIDGGPGDDQLYGSRGADRIIGGPGRDTADGSSGRDVCQAESVANCEVRG